MASEVRVNTITNRSGLSTVTFGAYGIEFVGITTVEQLNVSSAVTNINATGVSTFSGNIDLNADLDVDGHTELDGVNIAGVLTATSANFSGNVTVLGDLTYENVTNQDSIGIATARSGLRITGGGLDVVGVATFNDNINLGDNDVLNFGASQDLKIYHSGTNSFIRDSGTGSLYVEGTDLTLRAGDSTTRYLVGNQTPGDVSLYYGNSKKFETASSGINVVGTTTTGQLSVTGVSTFSGNVNLGDSNILNLGAGNDLKIYHNGTNNYIDNNADFFLRVNNGTETSLYATANGGVQLNYDNVKKFETTSTGIDVTGEVQGDSLDIDGNADISGNVTLHGSVFLDDNDTIYLGTGNDLAIYHNGSGSYIDDTGTGDLRIRANNLSLQKYTGENYFVGTADGAAYLYYDSAEKLNTTSTGINVTGTVTCDGLTSDGTTTIAPENGQLTIKDRNTGSGVGVQNWISGTSSDNTEHWYLGQKFDTNSNLYYYNVQNADIVLGTNNTGRVVIQNDGHLRPNSNNAYDLGTSSNQWRNAYFDGEVQCDALSVGGGATFDGGTSTTVNVVCDNGGAAEIQARGDSQGTGALFAGQSTGYGGGIFYNGDGTPAYATGEGADRVSFFRRDNNTNHVVFSCSYANNDVVFRGNVHPSDNNSYDLGTSSVRWRNLYTNDLNLSNEGSANDVDGTWGNYTIQEGEDDLFLINRRSGKKYKFMLQEVE